MADKKITQLTNITGANLVDADEFVVVDISADETKSITLAELKTAFDSGSGFVRITGDTMTGDLGFGDNDKAIFGAGSDLQIYHDGSHSRIVDAGTGNLSLQGNDLRIKNADATATYIQAANGGAVELAHNNDIKLATTATGIDVTGTITADGLTVDGPFTSTGIDDNATNTAVTIDSANRLNIGKLAAVTGNPLEIQANTAGGGLGIYGRASDGYSYLGFYANGVNTQYASINTSDSSDLNLRTGNTNRQTLASNGDISFYEDTGTTPKFFWDASTESLGIGTSSPTAPLEVSGSVYIRTANTGTSQVLRFDRNRATTGDIGQIQFYTNDGAANPTEYGRITGTATTINNGIEKGDLYFSTTLNGSLTERMRIGSTGIIYVNGDGTGGRISGDGSGGLNLQDGNGRQTFKIMSPASGSTQPLTLDASGNVLVGKTSNDFSTEGAIIRPDGDTLLTRDGTVLTLRRNTTDGVLVDFRKDGTTVGSIGTEGTVLYVGSGDTGVKFVHGIDAVVPYNPATPANRDAAIDLGYSTIRYKDLYLSGGVYLGGTVAANKLDDYEEGTWTAAASSGTLGTTTARYTRIGRTVYIELNTVLAGTRGAEGFRITGLPFTCGIWTAASMYCQVYDDEGTEQLSSAFKGSSTEIAFVTWGAEAIGTDFGNGYFVVNGTYHI